uniref:Uncharacterized protein n=1 Tax=Myotis myotis TaxID=51298 RepID=A0A7J7XH76_MYOMY|nr:hypothetical protein mMyoMyo1_011611 [Myotis myotis]
MQAPHTPALFPAAQVCVASRRRAYGRVRGRRAETPRGQSQAVPSEGRGGSGAASQLRDLGPDALPPGPRFLWFLCIAGLLAATNDAHMEAPRDGRRERGEKSPNGASTRGEPREIVAFAV